MLKYNVVARKNPQTKELLYYAQLVPVTAVGLSALAAAISNECTVTIHDIKAVLSALEEKVISYLQSGMSVRLVIWALFILRSIVVVQQLRRNLAVPICVG